MAELGSVLVVGSGGREAALLAEAKRYGVERVFSTRGANAVNIGLEGVINTGLGEDIGAIGSFASQEEIDLVIVGPEAPLVNGIGDALRSKGVPVFGPNAKGAVFEADKVATHRFVTKYGLPNPPNSRTFTRDQIVEAKNHIREHGVENIVTKRVGLEGGKGATVYFGDQEEAALREVDAVAAKGESILLQGRLHGPEYSAMFMLDGTGSVVATQLSRDHKALYDGGLGPNTGGMGAFAPLSIEQATMKRRSRIASMGFEIADGLKREGIDYRGVIYAGLMAETNDPNSGLSILEFNVRFGDPEMQVLLQSLGGRALDYMHAAAHGSFEGDDITNLYLSNLDAGVNLSVCLASPGYGFEKDKLITGLPIHVPKDLPEDISIQFAGAAMLDGVPVSTGGRVAYITKTDAPTLSEARTVYDYIGRDNGGLYIGDDEQVIRTDIGLV